MGERLFKLMDASGYDHGNFPHTVHELREGGKSTIDCAKEYLKWMDDNRMTATEDQKKAFKEVSACVVRAPLIHEPPCKFSGEPLHESSGMINHFFEEIRKIIRCWEKDEPFMKQIIRRDWKDKRFYRIRHSKAQTK